MSDDKRAAMGDALVAWMETRVRRSEFEQRRGDRVLGAPGHDRSYDDALEEQRLTQAEQYAETMYRVALADYIEARGHPRPAVTASTRTAVEPWPAIPATAVQGLLP